MLQTTSLMLPTKMQPNPIKDQRKLRVILDDGTQKEYILQDEAQLPTVQAAFDDMFFMLKDHTDD